MWEFVFVIGSKCGRILGMKKLVVLCLLSCCFVSQSFAIDGSALKPYSTEFFDYASGFVGEGTTECSRFVNRNFYARFGEFIWGSAWDYHEEAEKRGLLKFKWRVNDDDIDPVTLKLKERRFRESHYGELYKVLDGLEVPVGVAGFFYEFSFFTDKLFRPDVLRQTHVAMIAGRKTFVVENESDEVLTLKELWERRLGVIHDYEVGFINDRLRRGNMFARRVLSLDTVMAPGDRVAYRDYLVEEQFRTVRRHSLLEMYLKKHRNNHVMSLLRPVSFMQVSGEVLGRVRDVEKMKN